MTVTRTCRHGWERQADINQMFRMIERCIECTSKRCKVKRLLK